MFRRQGDGALNLARAGHCLVTTSLQATTLRRWSQYPHRIGCPHRVDRDRHYGAIRYLGLIQTPGADERAHEPLRRVDVNAKIPKPAAYPVDHEPIPGKVLDANGR